MATKPSPSWPPFRPKLRINGQTPSDRIFLSPKVLTSRVAFSPTRPPAFPSQADRPTRSATVFPSIARCISSNAEPSFRVSALPPTATLEIARYFGETFVAPSRDRLGESRRNGVGSNARDSTVNGRARFGNRAGSYLSSQLRIRCARHRCNYFAARSVNTPATDSRSIRGVNLSKALASARHSEYHLNALSVAAYTRLRSRVNAGRGIGRRRRWRGPSCRANFVARRKRRSTLDRPLLADQQRDRRSQDGSTFASRGRRGIFPRAEAAEVFWSEDDRLCSGQRFARQVCRRH